MSELLRVRKYVTVLSLMIVVVLAGCSSKKNSAVDNSSVSSTTTAPSSSTSPKGTSSASTAGYCGDLAQFVTAEQAAKAQFGTDDVSGVSKFANQASVAAKNIAATSSASSFWLAVSRIENGYSENYDYENAQRRQDAYQTTAADSAAIGDHLQIVLADARSKCNVDLNVIDWGALSTYVSER